MKEQWKPVVGWEGEYEVSDQGRVRKAHANHKSPKGHVLTPGTTTSGYRNVVLYLPRKHRAHSYHATRKTRNVHRLVAEAFLGPCPAKHQVNHKSGDKTDNNAANLEWVTASENRKHAFAVGLQRRPTGTRNPRSRLTEGDVRKIRALKGQMKHQEIANRFKVNRVTVTDILLKRTWKHLE